MNAPPHPRRRARVLLAGVGAAVALFFLVGPLADGYVDWLWFGEVHLRTVFWTEMQAETVLGLVAAAVFFAIFWANVEIARRLAPTHRAAGGVVEPVGVGAVLVRWVGLAVSLLGAAVVGLAASSAWLTFLSAHDGVPFGTRDPLFHRDIGFYVFDLPAWQSAYDFLFATLLASLVAAAVVHAALGCVRIEQQRGGFGFSLHVHDGAVAHVSAVLGALFLLTGFGELLDAWGLLFSSSGVVFGAGYTDVHARLPVARILMVTAWVLAAALLANVRRRRRKLPLVVPAVWLGVLLLGAAYPAAVQSLVVNPDQGVKEAEYIERNIRATRAAYAVDRVAGAELSLKGDLTAADLAKNDVTIGNVRLWDAGTLLHSYRQLQELRPYYTFKDVDVDRYDVDGVYRETMLSAREMNLEGLPRPAQTWVNRHITYTHGYGVAVSAVNQVTSDGSPDFLVQDIPVTSSTPSLAIRQPRIYYGEIGTDYTLVDTKAPEFDYPGPGGDVYRSYDGKGGIPIGSFASRLAFAMHFDTIKFFTSSAIDARSRIIIRNAIGKRLRAAAPFLQFDSDPYVVVADGRLYWIADAYTTTSLYPYATPTGDLNYLRNSVKAVVDAYDGTVSFYAFDASDPILRTYEKIFPGVFQPKSAMPASLRAHVRYPEDYFDVQAEIYTTYHVTSPSVFYNKGDQWEIPKNVALSGPGKMAAYYVVMRLPGKTREEFVLILPFSPNGRSNMIGWMGAESDGDDYGKAVSFAFPSSQTVYGPAQVEAVVNQEPTISSQRTLWGQQGSHVIFGNLLVVPVENSLLYVQPLYIEAEQTQLPQFKRVIVFYRSPSGEKLPASGQQQNVVMEPTLGEALAKIFGTTAQGKPQAPAAIPAATAPSASSSAQATAPPASPQTREAAKALVDRANREFDAAEKALRAGDFAGYGAHIREVKDALQKLQRGAAP